MLSRWLIGIVPRGNVTHLFTTPGAGSVSVPNGITKARVEAVGGGGQGNNTYGSAGGGGAYARTDNLTVTAGQTIYYSVGDGRADSWVNITTNAAPSATANGCKAVKGSDAVSSAGGAGGSTGSSVGTTKYAGAAGDNAGSGTEKGGGAGGDSGAASGQTGGSGTNITGGNGGAHNAAGANPGGGAGGHLEGAGYCGEGVVRIALTIS